MTHFKKGCCTECWNNKMHEFYVIAFSIFLRNKDIVLIAHGYLRYMLKAHRSCNSKYKLKVLLFCKSRTTHNSYHSFCDTKYLIATSGVCC